VAAAGGCRDQQPPPGPPTPAPAIVPLRADAEGWSITTGQPPESARAPYLGNGYVGLQPGFSGCGADGASGLPAYVAGLYVHEALAAIPSPAAVLVRSRSLSAFGEPRGLAAYSQQLRLREGLLATRCTWRNEDAAAEIAVTSFPHRRRPHLVVTRVRVRNLGRALLSISPPAARFAAPFERLTAGGALTAAGLEVATAPGGVLVAMATRFGPVERPIAMLGTLADVPVAGGQASELVRYTAVFTSLDARDPAAAALREVAAAAKAGVEALEEEHRAGWEALWKADIKIEGDPEAQVVARACQFYLLGSLRPEMDRGVPPMGLSSAAFAGHVFWDMDTWMLPAVLPQRPELARAMLAYRQRTLPGARANARAEGRQGAAFAWESASTGREVGPEPFRHGRHVDGDVALAVRHYWLATDDHAWLRETGWPLLRATADYWASRAVRRGNQYHLERVTTPDENAGLVDDSAWTNWGAKRNLEFAAETARRLGQRADPRWTAVARGLALPRDPVSGRLLQYAGYRGGKTKQADALLLIHPGAMPLSPAETGTLYDYYTPRVIANGPAMTDAIHAVVAARLGRGQEALARFRASYQPFLRQPFGMFSEKRSRDNLCFLTGAAGTLQAIVYGFAGLELREAPTPKAIPRLPPGWQAITLGGVRWHGKQYDLRVDASGSRWRPATPRTAGR
jgi:trehalose/maltose hydrolase-like predicted phosphorylase